MSKADTQGESKLVRELRKENIKLRREVKQLRKENSRVINDAEEIRDLIEEEQVSKSDKKKKQSCPKCRMFNTLQIMKLRGIDYYHCSDCGSKGRLK